MNNNNLPMLDRPFWEQLVFAPATGIAWTNVVDDWTRFAYFLLQTSATAEQFWRYDTWNDTWQQLATPPTQTGTIANMTFVDNIWGQFNWKTYWSIYLFVWNATTCYFYKYDIATNLWSANLWTTNVPANFWTDAYLISLSPDKNWYDTSYHNWVTRTITTSAGVAVWATSIPVNATSEAMPIWTRLRFWTFDITVTTLANKWATSLSISALPQGLAINKNLTLSNWDEVCLSASASAWATTISIYPLQKAIPANTIIPVKLYAVLTASAISWATSLTVSPLLYSIPSWSIAWYYGNMYLVGNNATQMYRYNLGANAWTTTSANSANPAIPAIPWTIWAWCWIKWIPWVMKDKLYVIRWWATNAIYIYDLVTNTISTLTYNPATETFTTWTSIALRTLNWKWSWLLISKEATWRIYGLDVIKWRNEPKLTQWLYPQSTAVVWDKSFCITSPDWIEFYYMLCNSSTAFLRTALLDS